MSSIVVIAILHTTGGESRQTVGLISLRNWSTIANGHQVVEALGKVAAYSKDNEPGVLRHATTVPREASDDKTLYVIEEWASL